MIFEKYKPLILGLWALFSFSVYSGNIYAKQTENTTVPQPVQNATVKGVVKDATGEPLIGVSVVVKGTTNGAVTDVMVISRLHVVQMIFWYFHILVMIK